MTKQENYIHRIFFPGEDKLNDKLMELLAEYREQTRDCWLDQKAFERQMPDVSVFGIEESGCAAPEAEKIYSSVAALRGKAPEDERLSALAREWMAFMGCADDRVKAKELAALAADDRRAAKRIDSRFGTGTAMLLRLACEEVLNSEITDE